MDVIKAIQTRKSIRKYQDKAVSDDLILELIEAARLAPSGNNTQASKFYIIKDKELKKKLEKEKLFSQKFVYQAPVIIACFTDPDDYKKFGKLDDKNFIRAIRDLSIASSFLVLRATELGLGTCYVGWVEKEKIKDILNVPKHFVIPYVITVGYADENPNSRDRKDLEEIILK